MAVKLKSFSPISINGTPFQVSTTTDVRSMIIYSDKNNLGDVFIAPSSELCVSGSSMTIEAGESYIIKGDEWGGEQKTVDLNTIYINGNNNGDIVIIQYLEE